jgi:hypothetical protein
MLDQIKDPPWEHDDKVVLEEKWRAANARADKCESLKGELDWIHRMPRSREAKLNSIEKTAASVAEVATIAIRGLYPRDLLSEDFQWFVEQQTHKLPEILNQIQEEICSVPNCPEFLFKEHTKDSKALITLIQSKRWEKLLPLFRKQADYLVLFACGFAHALRKTLEECSKPPAPQYLSDQEVPAALDELEEAAKKAIIYQGRELEVTGQARLVLVYLICTYPTKKSALDIESVITSEEKQDLKGYKDHLNGSEDEKEARKRVAKKISKLCYKVEKLIKSEIDINDWPKDPKSSDRPIQRQNDHEGRPLYSLNPKLSHLKLR